MYKIIGGDRKVYGPVSDNELRRWISEGRLNGQSLVQPEGAAEWTPLASLPEFAEALGVPPGPAPVPPALPVNPQALSAEVLSRQPSLDVGQCLAQSWRLFTANFGLFFGAAFLVWLIGVVCEWIPVVKWGYLLVRGPLYGGLYLLFLQRIRGREATVGDAFAGFRQEFLQLMLAGVVSSLLAGIGFLFCVLPWVYLVVAWAFAVPLVADKKLEFWSAMELSRKAVTRVWFQVFGLMLLAWLPVILATLVVDAKIGVIIFSTLHQVLGSGPPDPERMSQTLTQVLKSTVPYWAIAKFVLLLNLPFALGALMYAYEALFGSRPTAAS